ncbi:unnamed protein product [Dracunculus medinensis]|uniref:Rho-GAP domain-containing protein n=1 Tax=Dracunculus medinensis TaxID=318479 RepID=A0A158Q4A2_DRAME|nr:unnamed protein product [Dracunculus medinensis]
MKYKLQAKKNRSLLTLAFSFHRGIDSGNGGFENGRQKPFITSRLLKFQKISSRLHSEIVIEPAIQHFLAIICDVKINPEQRTRLGLRYIKTSQVQGLLKRLTKQQYISNELWKIDLNTIVTALKEILSSFPGGIFADSTEEFVSISPECSLQTALIYVNGLIEALPHLLRQFAYLICRSLKNLINQSAGKSLDAYTDALLLFTPILFPHSVNDIKRFLRAIRVTLILIDYYDYVFRPFIFFSSLSYLNDDDFFGEVDSSLSNLHGSFEADDYEGIDSNEDIDFDFSFSTDKFSANNKNYYQIAYLID